MAKSLGDCTSNLKALAVWKKDLLLGSLGNMTKMDCVKQAFIGSPNKSIAQASAELQMWQTTVHRNL
jgi:hypothetical protein